jgi:hypothetical protein
MAVVSIHAPRTGRDFSCDTDYLAIAIGPRRFNPRAPYGTRRADTKLKIGCGPRVVSIHAPRTGRDLSSPQVNIIGAHSSFNPRAPYGTRPPAIVYGCKVESKNVSIHAPRAGRDAPMPCLDSGSSSGLFQSTRPARGATTRSCVTQDPRAPRGATKMQ